MDDELMPNEVHTRSAIGCSNLSVSFGDTAVLAGVSLNVPTGQWLSIIGPNGAGKSTLLRALVGLGNYSGEVTRFGQTIAGTTARDRAKQVAFVPQTQIIPPGMPVLDYVLLGRNPWMSSLARESASDLTIAEASLIGVDALHLAHRLMDELSGGERQRVVVARAIAQEAPLLLLDEPNTSLDIGHQQELLELIDERRRAVSLTVIMTLHDLSLAGQYADRLVLMNRGAIVADGTAADVLQPDLLTEVYQANVQILTGEDGEILVVPRRRPCSPIEPIPNQATPNQATANQPLPN